MDHLLHPESEFLMTYLANEHSSTGTGHQTDGTDKQWPSTGQYIRELFDDAREKALHLDELNMVDEGKRDDEKNGLFCDLTIFASKISPKTMHT